MPLKADISTKPGTVDKDEADEYLDEKLERFSHLTAAILRSDLDKTGWFSGKDLYLHESYTVHVEIFFLVS